MPYAPYPPSNAQPPDRRKMQGPFPANNLLQGLRVQGGPPSASRSTDQGTASAVPKKETNTESDASNVSDPQRDKAETIWIVTLCDRFSDASIKTFYLHEYGDHVKLGRAGSIRPAGHDNGWLDCPVMSKHHAEMWINNGKLRVKDVGSLHGTFLNGVKLIPHVSKRVNNGSFITFGKSVAKRDSSHGPLQLKIQIRTGPSALDQEMPLLSPPSDTFTKLPNGGGRDHDSSKNRPATPPESPLKMSASILFDSDDNDASSDDSGPEIMDIHIVGGNQASLWPPSVARSADEDEDGSDGSDGSESAEEEKPQQQLEDVDLTIFQEDNAVYSLGSAQGSACPDVDVKYSDVREMVDPDDRPDSPRSSSRSPRSPVLRLNSPSSGRMDSSPPPGALAEETGSHEAQQEQEVDGERERVVESLSLGEASVSAVASVGDTGAAVDSAPFAEGSAVVVASDSDADWDEETAEMDPRRPRFKEQRYRNTRILMDRRTCQVTVEEVTTDEELPWPDENNVESVEYDSESEKLLVRANYGEDEDEEAKEEVDDRKPMFPDDEAEEVAEESSDDEVLEDGNATESDLEGSSEVEEDEMLAGVENYVRTGFVVSDEDEEDVEDGDDMDIDEDEDGKEEDGDATLNDPEAYHEGRVLAQVELDRWAGKEDEEQTVSEKVAEEKVQEPIPALVLTTNDTFAIGKECSSDNHNLKRKREENDESKVVAAPDSTVVTSAAVLLTPAALSVPARVASSTTQTTLADVQVALVPAPIAPAQQEQPHLQREEKQCEVDQAEDAHPPAKRARTTVPSTTSVAAGRIGAFVAGVLAGGVATIGLLASYGWDE